MPRAHTATGRDSAGGVTAVLAATGVGGWLAVGLFAGLGRDWLDVLFAFSGGITLVVVVLAQHVTGRRLRELTLRLDGILRPDDPAPATSPTVAAAPPRDERTEL